jgi:hypothetical protein
MFLPKPSHWDPVTCREINYRIVKYIQINNYKHIYKEGNGWMDS